MNGERATLSALDLQAVRSGIVWGLGILLVGGALQGVVSFGVALPAGAERSLPVIWQAVGCTVGGALAARRARSSGWLHGVATGMAIALLVVVVMSVRANLPPLSLLLRGVSLCTGAGLLGGILGINMRAS